MEERTQQRILSEFEIPTYDQWLQLVEQQLKGAPFAKKLVTESLEGISIQPIFRNDDKKTNPDSLPGSFPFKRGVNVTGNIEQGWQVSQHYAYPDPAEFNQAISYDLERGLNAVSFSLDRAAGKGLDPDQDQHGQIGKAGISIFNRGDLQKAFQTIDLSAVSLLIRPQESFLPFYSLLVDYLDSQHIKRDSLKGNLVADPLAELASTGKLSFTLDQAYSEMATCIKWSSSNTPKFKTLGVDLCPYADAGASATQELAIALATGVEYLKEMQTRDIDLNTVAENMEFYLAMGSDFFMNIAKIRAARVLWSQVVSHCGGAAKAQKMKIHASTGRYNKTIYDPHVNLLRATTEAYSAVLAGCASVSVAPFDEVFNLPDELSRRISRNIQIVLKEECHGHRIIDPGGGAWFLEELTEQLAAKSWEEFQQIEKQGGMSKALLQGTIQQRIADVAAKRGEEVALRKRVIVGTNMYPNQDEQPQPARSIDFKEFGARRTAEASACKSKLSLTGELTALSENKGAGKQELMDAVLNLLKKDATLGQVSQALGHGSAGLVNVASLKLDRLAAGYEVLRQKAAAYKSQSGELPQVFLVNMGPLKQHKARADFATGFLQPGGFGVQGSNGFDSLDDAVTATLASKAKIAVFCSTDDTYPELVPDFATRVKKARPDLTLVLAGYPKEYVESFTKAGIDEFIHLKANNLKLLKMFQEKAGVKP